LREARQAKGWSTLAVATMIGIRENDLYRYEFRLVKPNGDTLVKWLETLGFKISDPEGLGQ
jgi:ribosome-binding protein aMBF1 (putative translation factor)